MGGMQFVLCELSSRRLSFFLALKAKRNIRPAGPLPRAVPFAFAMPYEKEVSTHVRKKARRGTERDHPVLPLCGAVRCTSLRGPCGKGTLSLFGRHPRRLRGVQ